MKKFYLTTAIDYANGAPHIGHAYEKVLADVVARIYRLRGHDVHFLTGLDEHGQKVQQTASNKHISPLELCDHIASDFQHMCRALLVSNDDYIRTTQSRHKQVVQSILQQLYDSGDIYKAEYTGFYSSRAERFVQDKDKVDGHWPEEEFGEIQEITEINYFFKLSRHKNWLIEYISLHPEFIFPAYRAKQVLEFLKDDINDLCISRPKDRLSWGIELPFDKDYVTYVWFDALINYISAVGYGSDAFSTYWPADVQVIGKDILLPAHAVYWTIMLHALNLPLPKTLLVHGWWMVSGEKMSKSTGNVINPLEYASIYGPDAFRYFVIREMSIGKDSEFTHELFVARYTSDLGNDLGNLLSRWVNMLHRYCSGVVPVDDIIFEQAELDVRSAWETAMEQVYTALDCFQLHTALEVIFSAIRATNKYLEIRAPWKLSKSTDAADVQRLNACLTVCAEAVRISGALLYPFMPGISEKIAEVMGISYSLWNDDLLWDHTRMQGKQISISSVILFPRID